MDSDNESVKSRGSQRSSRKSSRRSSPAKSDDDERNMANSDVEERKSIVDSDTSRPGSAQSNISTKSKSKDSSEKQKVSDEVFGASDDEDGATPQINGHDKDKSPSRARSNSIDKSNDISHSRSRSRSKSSNRSRSKSSNQSRSRSRSGSRKSASRSRSRSGSRKSASRSRSRSGSRKSASRSRSRSGSRKIASRSRSRSGSRKLASRSRSRSGSRKSASRSRSRSGSRKSASRSRSRSGSRKSASRSRSRSGSRKSASRSRSRSGSRKSASRSRSRSGSRKSGSRSRSRSGSRSRSRSGSRKSGSRSRSRSGSRSGSRSRSRSRGKSGSRSRSRSGSRQSRSRSGSRQSRSRSRSKSGSRSHSRRQSKSGSRSRSRSVSGSRSRSVSGSRSGSQSRSGSDSEGVSTKRRRVVMSDSDDEDSSEKKTKAKKKRRVSGGVSGSDSEKSGDEGNKKFSRENSPAPPQEGETSAPAVIPQLSDSEDEGVRDDNQNQEEFVNDFELMMARAKELKGRRKKKNGVDIINDNEEHISIIVRQMREASEDDRKLNHAKKPAFKKTSMLDFVMSQIQKTDLIEGFLDANVLSVFTDWLSPMPDRSLPAPKIRERIFKFLLTLPALSQDMLKSSGIGKAVMYLYRHPKELKINKDRCGRLINIWSRPIFNNSDDFKSVTKDERLERDLNQSKTVGGSKRKQESKDTEPEKILRPGDKGWCYRARVPMPIGKDFVNRPKWTVEGDINLGKQKKTKSKIEKQMIKMAKAKALAKMKRCVPLSIEGKNMAL